jgi:hypothetical protein
VKQANQKGEVGNLRSEAMSYLNPSLNNIHVNPVKEVL